MNYTIVESSQIAEVGFGNGYYGPETLGIRFPPNKKQAAAKEPGSEYHYQNFTAKLFAEFLASESISSYFGKNIKSRPDLYPFFKVEAGPSSDPAPPAPQKTDGSGETPPSTTADAADAEPEGTVEPPPSRTALAVIDSTPADKLFAPGGITDAQIAAGRDWYLTEAKKYGIETEEKRTELKRFARPLQKLRTGIEARAKEFTGETKRKLAAIDTEKRRLVLLVGGIEDEVLRPLTEWEAEEELRKVWLSGIVKSLGEHVVNAIYPSIVSLEETIAELEDFDTSTMQEYRASAESAIAASLRVLKPELERRQEAERNAAELAELKRKQAERDEQDRQAEAKRQEEERIAVAVEKRAAEMVASSQAQVQPYIPPPREESGIPITPDWMELPEPGEVQPFVYPEIPASPTLTHKQAIHAIVAEAFMGCSLTRHEALAVLQAIVDGKIPYVSISY